LAGNVFVGDVCFIRKDEKVLLLLRKKEPMKGKWTGVGGKTEFDEEPLESCIREVKEETGLEIQPELAGVLTTINIRENSKWFLFMYVADDWKGKMKRSREGLLEWVSQERLHEKQLAFVGISFPYVLDRKRRSLITGKILHDGQKVMSCVLREGKKALINI